MWPQEGTILVGDAVITLQVVLAKAQQKGLRPEHMAWPNIAACVWLLCSTEPEALLGRASSGFSHRWPLHLTCGAMTLAAARLYHCSVFHSSALHQRSPSARQASRARLMHRNQPRARAQQ